MLLNVEKYRALTALGMLALWACQRSEVPGMENSPISLTAGVAGDTPAVTKAVISAGSGLPFAEGTSLYMVLKSEKDNLNPLFSRTIGFTEASVVNFASQYGRFWEDSYSRNSQLSVYAACVPGYYLDASVNEGVTPAGTPDAVTWTVGGSAEYDNTWKADAGSTTLAWPLRSASAGRQTGVFPAGQDLCFSNNVSGDARVTFDNTLKKFGSGTLIFNHALSKITFRIRMGEGFQSQDPFAFSNEDENIVLKGCILGGVFDIEAGAFTSLSEASDLTELSDRGAEGEFRHVLDALAVPGTTLDDDTVDGLHFTIDNNLYHLKKSMLMDALSGKLLADGVTPALDEGKLRPGVHYIFDMTVGKKKMDSFTASVVDWDSVEADETVPTNARIVLSLKDSGGYLSGDQFDLYRSANVAPAIDDAFESYAWETGYSEKASMTETAAAGVYETTWYWPNNKTFYHFRAVMPKDTPIVTDAADGDYLALTGGEVLEDICWGAPINQADGSVFKAIGPTEDVISMTLFHRMSDVTITLTTTDGADKVTLDGALLELNGIYPAGKVRVGSGEAEVEGTAGTVSNAVSAANELPWNHFFVPQDLSDVVLTITTTDFDQYKVVMKDVKVGSKKIARWEPGVKYEYTFKLTKAGIKEMNASLTDWKTVTAEENVTF